MLCCKDCGTQLRVGENWPESYQKKATYRCNSCKKVHNDARMYVNGKYIAQSHPLYKPGRYKSFNDAAFSGL